MNFVDEEVTYIKFQEQEEKKSASHIQGYTHTKKKIHDYDQSFNNSVAFLDMYMKMYSQ